MERFDSFSSSTTTDQLVFTKRQVSMIMASMLLLCLFVFIVGFFLGKRAVLDEFSSQVTQSSLQNQIDFLLTTQSLQSSHDQEDQENNDENVFESDEDAVTLTNLTTLPQEEPTTEKKAVVKDSGLDVARQAKPFKEEETLSKILGSDSGVVELGSKQYARLIGFGTKKAAQAFVARLKKQNVSVILKTMISKTASGKQRTWYQAITPIYENEQELQALVTKIKRLEHIRDNDIKIVSVK